MSEEADSSSAYTCVICGKKEGAQGNLLLHIDSTHFPDYKPWRTPCCRSTFGHPALSRTPSPWCCVKATTSSTAQPIRNEEFNGQRSEMTEAAIATTFHHSVFLSENPGSLPALIVRMENVYNKYSTSQESEPMDAQPTEVSRKSSNASLTSDATSISDSVKMEIVKSEPSQTQYQCIFGCQNIHKSLTGNLYKMIRRHYRAEHWITKYQCEHCPEIMDVKKLKEHYKVAHTKKNVGPVSKLKSVESPEDKEKNLQVVKKIRAEHYSEASKDVQDLLESLEKQLT